MKLDGKPMEHSWKVGISMDFLLWNFRLENLEEWDIFLLEIRGNICEKRWKRGEFDGFLYGTSMETWGNSMENRRKPWIPGDSCGKSVGIMLGQLDYI